MLSENVTFLKTLLSAQFYLLQQIRLEQQASTWSVIG